MKTRSLTRRAFLGGTAVATAGASMRVAAATASAVAPPSFGPDPVPIRLNVNGHDVALRVEPRSTLAETLRGALGLTGTKIACNRGACGACTVWLAGVAVCSCTILAIDVGEGAVTTIEGLAPGGELHPVQAAFVQHDAVQCGFCTPGMIMSAACLLQHAADPSGDDVRSAISGHICRCGTYPHVVEATLAAAKVRP